MVGGFAGGAAALEVEAMTGVGGLGGFSLMEAR